MESSILGNNRNLKFFYSPCGIFRLALLALVFNTLDFDKIICDIYGEGGRGKEAERPCYAN